ncbi:MAG: hypothetical protein ACXVMS_14540 [Flavisolibacter sp.]
MTATIIKNLLRRKIATAVLVTASLAAFATLGDGGRKRFKNNATPLTFSNRSFSLRSNYNYRSNSLFNNAPERNFILLNTVVTYQKGNATYVLPLKKKVFLDKVVINPAH